MTKEANVTVSFFPYEKWPCDVTECAPRTACFAVRAKGHRSMVVCTEHITTYVLMVHATSTMKASA